MGLTKRSVPQPQAAQTSSSSSSPSKVGKKKDTTFLSAATKRLLYSGVCFYLGSIWASNSHPEVHIDNFAVRQTEGRMPIMDSISRGFHPVYVYSNAKATRKHKELKSYSQAMQDLIVSALMDANDKKIQESKDTALRSSRALSTPNGKRFFVDLASNDAMELSNTILLEKRGWNGLCLEPNPIYWYGLASYRTCTIVGAFVGGSQEDDGKEVDVRLSNGVFGGIVAEGMDNAETEAGADEKPKGKDEKRNLVSILTVFQETLVPKVIDYFSLDVEGAETIVMDKFPWNDYKFRFITIERPKDDLKQMLAANGYQHVTDITPWGETLWFHEKSVALTKEEITVLLKEKKLLCNRWNKKEKVPGAC
jgi:hypothetical protein